MLCSTRSLILYFVNPSASSDGFVSGLLYSKKLDGIKLVSSFSGPRLPPTLAVALSSFQLFFPLCGLFLPSDQELLLSSPFQPCESSCDFMVEGEEEEQISQDLKSLIISFASRVASDEKETVSCSIPSLDSLSLSVTIPVSWVRMRGAEKVDTSWILILDPFKRIIYTYGSRKGKDKELLERRRNKKLRSLFDF